MTDDPLIFSFSGLPRGKGRPRASVRGGFVKLYTDKNTREYEAAVAQIAKVAMYGRPRFEGPLSVSLRFRIPIPASMSKKERAAVLAGEVAYLGRIDVDNAGKAILDALNGVCWRDDVQIARLFAAKVPSLNPGVDMKITPLGLGYEMRASRL